MADDDDDPSSSSSSSSTTSFHWPGAIPLSQWIMATAGFAVDDETIVRDFWVVVVDDDDVGSAGRSAKKKKKNQSVTAAAATARVTTTTKTTNTMRFDRSRRESLRSLLRTAVQQWTEQHNIAFSHNNKNKRMMNHLYPQNNQQHRPNKRQKKKNRSKTTTTSNNNNNNEKEQAAAAASAIAKAPALPIVPPFNHRNNNGTTALSTNILCQGFAWQPPYTKPVQRHLNAAVDYWVSSPHCQALHECLGDALLRYLWRFPVLVRLPPAPKALTHAATTTSATTINSSGDGRGGRANGHANNAWQICGPPLHLGTGGGGAIGTGPANHNKKRKRDDDANHNKDNHKDDHEDSHKDHHKDNHKNNHKDENKVKKMDKQTKKKRRRFVYRPVSVPKPLRPQFCLFRKGLLYKGLYTDKVGQNRLDDDAISSSPEALFRTMLTEYSISSTSSSVSSSSSSDHTLSGFLSTNLADNNDLKQPPEQESLWRSVCVKILHHHRRLDYHRLLDRYCPLPESYQQLPLAVLANHSYCSGKQVTEFCQRVLGKLLPLEFWGHEKNRSHFLQQTLPIICTLRRHERFPNQRLVAGLRVRYMKWLMIPTTTTNESSALSDTRRGHALLVQRVTCVLRWWVQRFLWESLLPRLFYATDTELLGKQEIVYYRNPIWSLLRNRALLALVDDPQRPHYERIQHDDVTTTATTVSRLRLLPKSTGVRPIATLHCAMIKSQKSANAQLADAFTVLSHCLTPTTQHYGAGMQGMHELHAKYRSYLLQQRAHMKKNDGTERHLHQRLYFCSMDIRHCYDNIQVDHLLQLLEREVLREPKYMMQKYFVAFANGTVKKRVVVGRPGDCRPFPDVCQGDDDELLFDRAVYIDGAQQQVVSSRDILASVRDHFERNTVVVTGRYGHRYYRQVRGIPQGSVISTQCCNVYYGDMEKRLGLSSLSSASSSSSSSSLLVRMMDDFLLITTDIKERTQFLDRMAQGLPEKGVEIHPDKTKVSGGDDETNHSVAVEECWFPWCGFLFHTTTGHVKLDYTRFYDNGLVAGGLTVRYQYRPGDHLRFQQLLTFCRPRCVPLLFDPAINTIDIRRYNFYQLMAFCAVKTCAYLDALHFVNGSFLSSAINETIIYAYRLIRLRLRHELHDDHVSSSNGGRRPSSSCFLGRTAATWLGRKAWNDVVRYKKGGGPNSVILLELPVLSRQQRGRLERVAACAWKELRVDRLIVATRTDP
jgi:telomerase reverse transcriptase